MAGAFSLLAGVSACGDDDGTSGPDARPNTPDAAQPGDDGGGSDAAPNPAAVRSGTIAVGEVALTNPVPGQQEPLKGAFVTAAYTDLTTVSVAPAYGMPTTQLGDCSVWIYDATSQTDKEPAEVDEGPITVTGGLSPIGTCVYNDQVKDYVCPFASGAVAEATSVAPGQGQTAGTATITFPAAEFADKDVAGMFVQFSGFASAENNGRFPIVAKPADTTIVIANPVAKAETVAAGSAGTYTVLAGAGPTPARREFLEAETELTVAKAAGDIVPAFETKLVASGEGLTLDDQSAQPHLLPSVAQAEVTFSCGGQGGDCGPSPEGAVSGFVLSGRTTDADLTGAGPFDMPVSTGKYAVFQCRGVPGETAITIKQEALDAILSTRPTRIETRLLRITADLFQVPTSVVVGHALVGYTNTELGGPQPL